MRRRILNIPFIEFTNPNNGNELFIQSKAVMNFLFVLIFHEVSLKRIQPSIQTISKNMLSI
ncbi:hypothetical protein VME0621_02673 [Vibrio mediterranei]|nr:hypothetical protein VME0621_02673 [Vibrio mediterranei]